MPDHPTRPEPFAVYTTPAFWDDDHVSASMLAAHLDPLSWPASRPHAFIDASVEWLVTALDPPPGAPPLAPRSAPRHYANRVAPGG
ncbi:MAG TPA: class I SAM-dependent methyltransferase, partial [Actinotalea sp.]|nr:class I SAM-dependent methyltransferase [Actinotalea sp.]